jgi:DNA-binding CsgD family transcriptional regulator
MAKSIKVENKVLITAEIVDIVRLLSEDKSVLQIAEILKINRRTLEAKLILIKKECGVKTLQGMVGLFFRNKLIK